MDTPHELIRALRAPDQRSCGRMAGGMGAAATDRLSALDAASESIRAWSPMLIPGLLQTTLYALAAIRSRTPSLPEEEAGRRMQTRVRRQENFLRRMHDDNRHAWFIVGEAALTQALTGPDYHAHQLDRLLEIMDAYPRVQVRVLPDDASTAGTMEPFSIHALADGPRVGHLETIVGGWYTTRSEDVTRLYSAFGLLGKNALEPGETRRVISECLSECRTRSGEARRSSSRPTATPTTACSSPGPAELPPSR